LQGLRMLVRYCMMNGSTVKTYAKDGDIDMTATDHAE
jgi:hypothetical protein